MSGLFSLIALGAQDIYLSGNPEITYVNVAYRRHTNFYPENHQYSNSANIKINHEHIKSLKLKIKQNDVKAMRTLAQYYATLKNYEKMLKYYILYITNVEINKLYKIIKVCRETKNIKQFGELGDLCLDRLPIENIIDECPICIDGCGKYKTLCCNQYAHHNCIYQCTSCPFCRAKIF